MRRETRSNASDEPDAPACTQMDLPASPPHSAARRMSRGERRSRVDRSGVRGIQFPRRERAPAPRRRSSAAEQRFRKPQAVGSNPTAGSLVNPLYSSNGASARLAGALRFWGVDSKSDSISPVSPLTLPPGPSPQEDRVPRCTNEFQHFIHSIHLQLAERGPIDSKHLRGTLSRTSAMRWALERLEVGRAPWSRTELVPEAHLLRTAACRVWR
jgi:hypothetical protein